MTFSCPELTLDQVLSMAKEFGYDGVEPRIRANHQHGVEFDTTKQTSWNADPHLIATYGFIGEEETRQFIDSNPDLVYYYSRDGEDYGITVEELRDLSYQEIDISY